MIDAVPRFWFTRAARAASCLVLLFALTRALKPFFTDTTTYGFHDWDSHAAYRYITVLALKAFEGPWWHPYISGGYPAWGYVEGATNFISPYLPAYLFLPIRWALRIETLGSTVTALAGAWFLASRFTKSAALAALVAALFALNGRWALQMTAGHTWHMRYALLPWIFLLFDNAVQRNKLKWAVYGGLVMALMIYMGGIYPAPHTALTLGFYALVLAILDRSVKPLVALAVLGSTSFGFAAPKLLPIFATMARTPRTINSPETVDIQQLLVMMTEHNQPFYGRPAQVPIHGWHEYGIYIGWVGVAVIALGLLFAQSRRGQAMRIAGLAALLLGMGAFHPDAPWPLLHKLPLFSSQWVPSRYLYPMVLLLALAFASAIGPWLDRLITRFAWLDVALLAPVLLVAVDLATVSATTMTTAFHLIPPDEIPYHAEFHQEQRSPYQYKNPDPHAESVLLAMFANVGVVIAYGTPLFEGGHAIARGNPEYRGEAHVAEGPGEARIVRWTPNSATVEVTGASPGAMVVYNQNADPGWSANGDKAGEWKQLVAAPVPAGGSGRVVFRYYPPGLNRGLALCFITAFFALILPATRRLWPAWGARLRSMRSAPMGSLRLP
ncbi:MAG: hypothetical protein ABW133_12890 [Polyangiaceae bacterium]